MTSAKVDSKVDSGAIKTIVPVEGEPTRFLVPCSDPTQPPYMVDLDDNGVAHCECQIVHNRTESRAKCHHIRDARIYSRLRGKTILRLNLRGCYFDAIKRGEKKQEFRLAATWERRLAGKSFEEVHLLLGYPKRGDETKILRRRWVGYTVETITHPHFGDKPVTVLAIDVTKEL